jgi:hypothetical protein
MSSVPLGGVAALDIVRDHFETCRTQAASLRDDDGLPRFVAQEFRDFLRCGCLAAGFARFRCAACGQDRPFPLLFSDSLTKSAADSGLIRAVEGGRAE